MADLDFSGLSDDQLVGLFRAVCQEAAARNPAVAAACRDAGLDEAERSRIAAAAAEREAAALRARERQRVAEEAVTAVRAAAAAADDEAGRRRRGEAAREKVNAEKAPLRELAGILGRDPASITVVVLPARGGGTRVLVNEGDDRYARAHLVDVEGGRITTARELVGRKVALLAACTALSDKWRRNCWVGASYDWTGDDQQPAAPAGATA